MIAAIAAIVTAVVIGLPLVLAVDRGARGAMLIGLAFLYGTGAIYFVLLVLGLFHWSLLAAMLLLAAAWLVPRRKSSAPSVPVRWSIVDAATLAAVAAYAFVATASRAYEWDFWSIWGLKARAFFEAGRIDWQFLGRNAFTHPDYPLLVPLNFDFVAMIQGGWDDRSLGLLYVAFAVAVLLVVRALAAEEVGAPFAAAIAFAATAFALQRAIGLADAPLIAFSAAGVLMIRRGSMLHGAILLGLAATTKNEGLALLVAAAVALAITSGWRRVASLWPALAIAAPWLVLRAIHQLPSDLAASGAFTRLGERLQSLPTIAGALAANLPKPWIWIALLIGLVFVGLAFVRKERFVLITIALWFSSFVGVYLTTPYDPSWHIATSWSRVAPPLGIPLLFVVMVALARMWPAGEDHAHAQARSDR